MRIERSLIMMDATQSMPIVLLHGFMQDASSWDPVHLLGLRFVPSYTVDTDGSMNALIARVDDVVRKACEQTNSSRVVVCGYSMGGRVAALYAVKHPERIASLVLESAGLGCQTCEDQRAMKVRNDEWAQRIEESLPQFVDWWEQLPLFATQQTVDADIRKRQREARLANDPQDLARQLRDAGVHCMPLEADVIASLADLSIPIHYIVGAKDAKYCAVADRLPASISVHMVDAGHNVHMENPRMFENIWTEKILASLKGDRSV